MGRQDAKDWWGTIYSKTPKTVSNCSEWILSDSKYSMSEKACSSNTLIC